MFEEKPSSQIYGEKEENEKKYLPKKTEMKIDGEKENLSEELKNAVLVYLLNEEKIKGLQEGEKYSLCFGNEDLIVELLDKKGEVDFAWLIEDKKIISEVEKLISAGREKNIENINISNELK